MPSSCLNLEEKTSKIWGNLIQLLPIQNSQSLTVSRNYCKKEKNEGFFNCKYLQWATLHVDEHTVTEKTYLCEKNSFWPL